MDSFTNRGSIRGGGGVGRVHGDVGVTVAG